MQFPKEIINGKSMSATGVNQNRGEKILQRARDWLLGLAGAWSWDGSGARPGHGPVVISASQRPRQLIMGLRENEQRTERELQKPTPDNDNAAFCSAFIQLQTTGHSLKMGATVQGISREGVPLFAVFMRRCGENEPGNRFPARFQPG